MANFTVNAKTLARRPRRSKTYSRTGGRPFRLHHRGILVAARVVASAAQALFPYKRFADEQPAPRPHDQDDRAARSSYDSLSDDGPLHFLADRDARRQVLFAYVFYGVLAAALLATFVWR